jgi:hypothetical protein
LQVPFVDYGATFAPVVKSITIWFIAVYSALQGWLLQCFDAMCAFLHDELTNVIFMQRPCPLPPGLWCLLKSIYSLKQASWVWYRLLQKVLETLGFTYSEFDHTLFIFNRTWGSSESLVCCLLTLSKNGIFALVRLKSHKVILKSYLQECRLMYHNALTIVQIFVTLNDF